MHSAKWIHMVLESVDIMFENDVIKKVNVINWNKESNATGPPWYSAISGFNLWLFQCYLFEKKNWNIFIWCELNSIFNFENPFNCISGNAQKTVKFTANLWFFFSNPYVKNLIWSSIRSWCSTFLFIFPKLVISIWYAKRIFQILWANVIHVAFKKWTPL